MQEVDDGECQLSGACSQPYLTVCRSENTRGRETWAMTQAWEAKVRALQDCERPLLTGAGGSAEEEAGGVCEVSLPACDGNGSGRILRTWRAEADNSTSRGERVSGLWQYEHDENQMRLGMMRL